MNKRTRLQQLLDTGTTRFPDKTALHFENRSYSYVELHRFSQRLAGGLKHQGVAPGDRVALFLPNCPEAVMAYLACYSIGAIAVPLNYRYLADEARYVLEQTDAKIILFHSEQSEIVSRLRERFDPAGMFMLHTEDEESDYPDLNELFAYPELSEPVEVPEEHPAFILYTSGSTGRPKGVTHSHRGAYHGIEISRKALDFNHQDVVLVGKPISHAGGLQTQMMPAFSVGAVVVLAMKLTPDQAVSLVKRFDVTEYGMLASDLLDFIENLEAHPTKLSTLTNSIGSGDAVPIELHHRFRDLFGWEILEGCGMTEVGCYYAMNPRYGPRRWGSMGKPCPETRIRVVNPQGEEVPYGETGEIEVRSPAATTGYWNDDASSRKLFRDDWLVTGDLAYYDEEGYLWFVGRKRLMIVRRGSNISPIEVENVIDEHPGVHASVVVGIPDPRDGQVPVACIAPLHGAAAPTIEELHAYAAARLSAYKTPVHYLFFEDLPHNATGKFARHRLEESAASMLAES